ncbi:MAG: 7TM diverse intracellular signaling domain-containing protein [Polaromonas sp.]|uniref:7TM diverse intracellular signaling domain-containing protein n=1 Tax=Polaromonas sp. TaxID=1869339 RepID=UPI00273571AF|nr:7TM diverse intracellular signaling domain-containing protein [Polaromonas sp.]MDP2816765.1 7TM diverse intracellular signaling domain-containing protein [Polaromonas sp.]
MTHYARLLWIVLFAIPCYALPAAAQDSRLALSSNTTEVALTPWVRIVKDADKNKTVEQILNSPLAMPPGDAGGAINFGYTDAAYWFVIPLDNTEKNPLERLLMFEPTWLDEVNVTLVDASGQLQTQVGGDTLPFAQRAELRRQINFNLVLPPGQSTLVVRVASRDTLFLVMSLLDRSALNQLASGEAAFFGFFYGALIALIAFNFVLYLSVRQPMYLAYCAYVGAFLLIHSVYNGHAFGLIFRQWPELSNWAHSLFAYLFALSGLVFASVFLDLKHKLPRIYGVWQKFLLVFVVYFFATFPFGYGVHARGAVTWIAICSVFVLGLGIISMKQGNSVAKYYLAATAAGLIGTAITSLTVLGILPYTFATFRAVDFGMLVDAILLSLALAERISRVNSLERLRRFFSPAVANQLLSARNEDLYRPHQREIVVVFLDLRGYTSFTLKHGPEEVMRMLAEFHAVMGELIASHGATLERFAGDGMMLFFNDPVEIPDPAVKACRMTMEMQSRFEDLQKTWAARSYSLSLGVGIAQGVATIGAIGFEGRRDYAAIGNVTNLAARLCSQAQGGQTIVCSVVAKNVSTTLSVQPMTSLSLKGFDEPVECFELGTPLGTTLLAPAIPRRPQEITAVA